MEEGRAKVGKVGRRRAKLGRRYATVRRRWAKERGGDVCTSLSLDDCSASGASRALSSAASAMRRRRSTSACMTNWMGVHSAALSSICTSCET